MRSDAQEESRTYLGASGKMIECVDKRESGRRRRRALNTFWAEPEMETEHEAAAVKVCGRQRRGVGLSKGWLADPQRQRQNPRIQQLANCLIVKKHY